MRPVVSVRVTSDRGGASPSHTHAVRLVDRSPQVSVATLLGGLVPPPLFADVSFESYHPDQDQPTQVAAVAAIEAFARRIFEPAAEQRWWRRAPKPPEERAGIYVDGGFGVGKTHLLAALWHAVPGPKAFATFVELTHLVGALGFNQAVEHLGTYRLVCIDEFELDDPGDTMLMSSLLTRLTESGVKLAASSNTLPDRLGEDRFAAADFLREIHGLAAHFDVVRIDGPDYRHREAPRASVPASQEQLDEAVENSAHPAVDDFDGLLAHLSAVHPSRYGALVEGLDLVGWRGVRTFDDEAVALRFVVLVDRLYDHDIRVVASGVPLDEVFTPEMLHGGYRKKYFRALSRLVALAS